MFANTWIGLAAALALAGGVSLAAPAIACEDEIGAHPSNVSFETAGTQAAQPEATVARPGTNPLRAARIKSSVDPERID